MSAHFSNGTEGFAWMENWCDRCENDHACHREEPEHGGGCEVLLRELTDQPVPEFIEGTGRLGDTVHCIEFRPCKACGEGGGDDDGDTPPRIPIHPDQGVFFDASLLAPGVPSGVLLDECLPSVLNPSLCGGGVRDR